MVNFDQTDAGDVERAANNRGVIARVAQPAKGSRLSGGMLVRYTVDYSATFRDQAIHNKSIIGEVWEKALGDWKLVYFQETKLK